MTDGNFQSTMEKNQRLELLKDVFTLIHPELVVKTGAQGEKDNEERKARVQTWLDDIVQATSQEENPWKVQDRDRGGLLNLLPQFMHLLRECILTHQWTQVLSMVKCLSHLPYGADWVTWKATLTALYTEPESNIGIIQEFFKHCYLLKECNVWDVALEFSQYLISQGLMQEASQVIQTARKARSGRKSEQHSDLIQHAMTLLDGYQGLIFYVDWKAAINKQLESSQNTLSQSFYSLTSSQRPSDDAVRNIARRATLGLDAVLKKSGVWDIFLTKSVEIHEYYEEFDKAKDLLCAYRHRNPDNPNAHRYIYEYLSRNSVHHDEVFVNEESLCCLKSLAKLDPANPLVLTLWQKLTADGERADEALCYIFDLLDYEVWQEKAEGWHCLAKSLGTGLSMAKSQEERNVFITVLTSCWSSRKDWWPEYHFRSSAVMNQLSSHQLLSSKVIAAAVLIGQDCHFTTEARTVLNNTSSSQLLDNVLSDLDWNMITEFTEQIKDSGTTHSPQTPRKRSKRLSAVSASCPSASKGGNSFTSADMQYPDSSEMRNSPLTSSGNAADSLQKCDSSFGYFPLPDEGHSSDGFSSVDLSSGTSASVDFSSSDLSSSETDTEGKQHMAGPSRRLKLPKTKRKRIEKSGVSNVQKQDIFEDCANTSKQRKKRKRRAEDVDDVDSRPLKQRRTET